MKFLALALTLISPLAAHAADKPLLDCWDGSFAYNTAVVENSLDGPQLLRVELKSENQSTFLKNITLGQIQGWGQAEVAFYVPRKECQQTGNGRDDLLNCETKSGILEISYDESLESHKTLRLVVRDLKFVTQLEGATMKANLNFDAGSIGKGTVDMAFRTEGGVCRGLNDH